MKKVTVYLADETVDLLNVLAQTYDYYKYPQYQAYGLIIDEVVAELNKLSKVPVFPRSSAIAAKPISCEDVCFCCPDLKRVVAESEIGSLIAVYVKRDKDGGEWSAECPYCHAKLVVNEEGMIEGVAKEE